VIVNESLTLAQKVLLAALKCADAAADKSFTAEALSVQAWTMDRNAFGLRGFENQYPDSNKLFKSIDSKGGLVAKALITKIGDRTFKLTAAGVAQANALQPASEDFRKPDRGLAAEVNKMISHPTFREWLSNSAKPAKFYGAGHFWGIAPGTPPRVIRDRVKHIEVTLSTAIDYLNRNDTDVLFGDRDQIIAERGDIERCVEFHDVLKKRFSRELSLLSSS
jgi:hypothetical protein